MPIRALYKTKEAPLPLAVDIYEKAIVPSIKEESVDVYYKMIEALEFDYFATDTEEKCPFADWSKLQNDLYCTRTFLSIFDEAPWLALWVVYEALAMVLKIYPDHRAGYIQFFSWDGQEFLIKARDGHVIFLTPNDVN